MVERLRGKSILRANIPVSCIKMMALVNLKLTTIFNSSPMLTPGKVRELTHPDWVADNTRLSRETGWVPRVSLEKGLRYTFDS